MFEYNSGGDAPPPRWPFKKKLDPIYTTITTDGFEYENFVGSMFED